MRKILTLIPAGEVYNHDCVRWYRAYDIQRSINHYHNIGDAFVHDSSLKLLDYDVVETIDIRNAKPGEIDRYNSEFDYCFIRGSNYINEGMDWHGLPEILDQLKIPVLALGIGAQAPSCRRLVLSEQTRRVMSAISHHCQSIGVRGAYTAEVLAELGIKNVRVVGCPTLFRGRDPNLRIQIPAPGALRSLGFTLRREVSSTYTSDIKRYVERQRETVLTLAQRFELTLLAQGEIEEKKIVLGTPQQRDEAFDTLFDEKWLQGPNDPLTHLYASRLRYSDVVADYDAFVKGLDAVLGYRLHGNLIALANGVPSVYFLYDSRTAEFASTFSIPAYDIYGDKPFVLEEYWEQARFDAFNAAYRRGYDIMRAFLAENAIAHRLDGAPTAASADPSGLTAPSVAVPSPAEPKGAARAVPREDVEGYIDRIQGQRVSGWAWCRSRPDVALDIDIRFDDVVVASVKAEKFRADLARASVGDGHHAYEVVLDRVVSPDQYGRVTARARCGPEGPLVPLKNRTVTEPEAVRREERAEALDPPPANAPTLAASPVADATVAGDDPADEPVPGPPATAQAVARSEPLAEPAAAGSDVRPEQILAAVAAMGVTLEERLQALRADLALRQAPPPVTILPPPAFDPGAGAAPRDATSGFGRGAAVISLLAAVVAVASLLISLSSFVMQAGFVHPRAAVDPLTARATLDSLDAYRTDR